MKLKNYRYLFCLLLGALISSANADSSSLSVPLQVIDVGNQDYKVGITVSVAGGPPTLVTFDTGGTGLHIFASQVGNLNLKYTNQTIKSRFASGLVYEGKIAYAPVSFGSITTPPIPISVIQKAYCLPTKPNCGAGGNPSSPTPVMGYFYGELGAGMIPETHQNNPLKTLYTPLRALPGNYGSGFIVKNLRPNGTGELVLGLNAANTANLNTVQLPQLGTYPDGTPYYDDKGTMVQYSINSITDTLRTVYDTGGGPIVRILSGNQEGYLVRGKIISPKQSFSATLNNAYNWQFITGRKLGYNRVGVFPIIPSKGPYVNTGISFYFQYNIAYDFKNGMLGFETHVD